MPHYTFNADATAHGPDWDRLPMTVVIIILLYIIFKETTDGKKNLHKEQSVIC